MITYTFADDIALAMTIGKIATTSEDVVRQAEIARDGVLNFVLWARALVATYRDTSGRWLGDPVEKEKLPPAGDFRLIALGASIALTPTQVLPSAAAATSSSPSHV